MGEVQREVKWVKAISTTEVGHRKEQALRHRPLKWSKGSMPSGHPMLMFELHEGVILAPDLGAGKGVP